MPRARSFALGEASLCREPDPRHRVELSVQAAFPVAKLPPPWLRRPRSPTTRCARWRARSRALLRSFDAEVNRLQAALDVKDCCRATAGPRGGRRRQRAAPWPPRPRARVSAGWRHHRRDVVRGRLCPPRHARFHGAFWGGHGQAWKTMDRDGAVLRILLTPPQAQPSDTTAVIPYLPRGARARAGQVMSSRRPGKMELVGRLHG
jgi:hypothetical protein